MKMMVLRRTMVVGATGVFLALFVALGAVPVAADRDGAEPSSSAEPTASTDQPAWPTPIGPAVAYYPPGYGVPVTSYYPPGYVAPNYPAYAGGTPYTGACCLYTAAGPIVGQDANGSTLVYDVRGGTIDAYTTDKNGVVCEADTRGNCVQDGTHPHP